MNVIIMAGGMGKRMGSDLPKVLHMVTHPIKKNLKYPMIVHVLFTAFKLNPKKIFIVVGKYKEIISNTINSFLELEDFGLALNNIIEYVNQENAMGTGHAIKCCLDNSSLSNDLDSKTLILSGDVPLISLETLMGLGLKEINSNNKLLVTKLLNPFGCGRILTNDFNNIIGIKEEKDCGEIEKQINMVNCGIYQIKTKNLYDLIPLINNNNKSGEYYLTDIIDLMVKNNICIETFELETNKQWEIKNVNTKKDLEELNEFIQNYL